MGITVELHNSQFLGDLVAGTTAPRDMAAVRQCSACSYETVLPNKAIHKMVDCPSCGRPTLGRKFQVRFNTGGKPHFQQIFYGNPYLDYFPGNPDIYLNVGTQLACNRTNSTGCHITEAFRMAIMAKTGFDFPMGERLPDLHLTEDEKRLPPIIEGRYWVIASGKRPPFTSKFWPPERWQYVISQFPEITFVQIGFEDGKKRSEHYQPKIYGDNMIDMIGQTQDARSGIRDLFRLVYHADGCLSLASSLMHIAAGFRKPCVVIGGAREPARFEMYPFHRYIHYQGAMKCVGKDPGGYERDHQGIHSCWKQSTNACPNLDQGYPTCMLMIDPEQVIDGMRSYYVGGALEMPKERAIKAAKTKPKFKIVCNARYMGGGERSAVWIANRMLLEGYEVSLIPTGGVCREFSVALSPHVILDSLEHPLTEQCDILMVYANDMTGGFDGKYGLLEHVNAKKKIMVLNYRLMQAGQVEWSRHWDRYTFLCSELEQKFKKLVPGCNSLMLPPPVDLKPFLDADLGSLDKTLHVVRIGSQGESKYPDNIREVVERIHAIHPPVKFTMMGGSDKLKDLDYVDNIKEYSKPVMDIMKKGSVFWYPLPEDYLDNGPRVIMEAMAAGLPVVADNRGGAKDRIVPGTGWLCDSDAEHIQRITGTSSKEWDRMGKAAKEYARAFDSERWIDAILGKDGPVVASLTPPSTSAAQSPSAVKDEVAICFFTMADKAMIDQARSLILSGDIAGRPIWFYRIPADHPDPKRYKLELLASDLLPDADKYVYIDADSLMLKHGDWESGECLGAKYEHWGTGDGYENVFTGTGFDVFRRLHKEYGSPPRLNSGLVVLPGNIRKQFAKDWLDWCHKIDALSSEWLWIRDQMGYMFAHKQYNLPVLPERFSCIVKREKLTEKYISLHAAGHPKGEARKQYTDAIDRILGGNISEMANTAPDCRWQVLADLIMRYAEDPAHPVIAEMGVFKGEATRHLLRTFPGLRIYCIDNRDGRGNQRRHKDTDAKWNALMAEYPDRIIFYKQAVMDVIFPEELDLIFDDSDHSTELVVAHARRHWGAVKSGGVYAVHDIDYDNGSYYDEHAVRKGLDILWPGQYQVGPDYMAWVVK